MFSARTCSQAREFTELPAFSQGSSRASHGFARIFYGFRKGFKKGSGTYTIAQSVLAIRTKSAPAPQRNRPHAQSRTPDLANDHLGNRNAPQSQNSTEHSETNAAFPIFGH